MKFLQKWEGSELPTLEHNAVLLNEETKKITIKKSTPTPVDPYEYVDLGLPSGLLWATCNVGATKPEEYGLYFQWGATEGYEYDSTEAKAHSKWSTAPFNNGSSSYDSTYFASVSGTVCPSGVLAVEYDAAHVNMGGDWRMPTSDEFQELTAKTTFAYTQVNGVNCLKLTSKSDTSKSIVFPAAGYCNNGSFYLVGSLGYVWASSLGSDGPSLAWNLSFSSDDVYVGNYGGDRYNGFPIRGVKPKQS